MRGRRRRGGGGGGEGRDRVKRGFVPWDGYGRLDREGGRGAVNRRKQASFLIETDHSQQP